MKITLKKVIAPLIFVSLLYPSYLGYKYYVRCTYLPTRYPFVSANGFRHFSDHFFDHPERYLIQLTGQSFAPEEVKDGDIIFIKDNHYYLSRFFTNIHPRIKAHYILLSHNGDTTIPGAYAQYLDDDKLIAWCGCNVGTPEHKKMIPIPLGAIGLLNKKLPDNCEEIFGKILIDIKKGKIKKDNLVYFNVCTKTNQSERGKASEYFKNKSFCTNTPVKPYAKYLREMASFKFVISPHGTGFDCYRTWEALLFGCIPIVKKSCIDILYEGLPVLIVDDWNQVTEEFLEQKYQEMSQQKYHLERLSLDYWLDVIKQRTTELMNQK